MVEPLHIAIVDLRRNLNGELSCGSCAGNHICFYQIGVIDYHLDKYQLLSWRDMDGISATPLFICTKLPGFHHYTDSSKMVDRYHHCSQAQTFLSDLTRKPSKVQIILNDFQKEHFKERARELDLRYNSTHHHCKLHRQ